MASFCVLLRGAAKASEVMPMPTDLQCQRTVDKMDLVGKEWLGLRRPRGEGWERPHGSHLRGEQRWARSWSRLEPL